MSEKTDFNLMRKNLSVGLGRLERIENMAGVGTPDVNYCFQGVEGWIEIKSPTEPKRAGSKLFAGKHKLSQVQMNWFLRQRNAGGIGWVLICTDKRWVLVSAYHADDINKMTVDELRDYASWDCEKPITKIAWMLLKGVLNNGH